MSKIAFIFPGQGSQSLGMLGSLAESFPSVGQTFAQASEALGYDLWQLIQQGPEELLNQTDRTQPALLAASVALWRIWQQQGGSKPAVMAGHSLGEYTALVCANALDFATAIQLVAERGKLMQQAVPEGQGSMAAIIGLEDAQVTDICMHAAQQDILAPANFNAHGQVVVAGTTAAVERVILLAKEAGAKLAKKLTVSVPSHCLLMKPAAQYLAEHLAKITLTSPEIPIINNVDVKINQQPAAIKDALVRQLYSPVRWVETIQTIAAMQTDLTIECGPGKVLLGLNKRIDPNLASMAIYDPDTLAQALRA